MAAIQHPITLASTPSELTLSREGKEGKQESITIPLDDIEAICEVLRQAKQAIRSQQAENLDESPPEVSVPLPESLPESVVKAWEVNEADILPPVSETMPEDAPNYSLDGEEGDRLRQ